MAVQAMVGTMGVLTRTPISPTLVLPTDDPTCMPPIFQRCSMTCIDTWWQHWLKQNTSSTLSSQILTFHAVAADPCSSRWSSTHRLPLLITKVLPGSGSRLKPCRGLSDGAGQP